MKLKDWFKLSVWLVVMLSLGLFALFGILCSAIISGTSTWTFEINPRSYK